MEITRVGKTSDRLGRYYTEEHVARVLVDAISVRSAPNVVIDLGAGDGALVAEVGRRWAKARIVTVDIDRSAEISELQADSGATHSHHIANALEDKISQKIGLSFGTVDTAVCNPPYLRPKWRKHFANILEEVGLSSVTPRLGNLPSDILFLAQNLRFLRDTGKLGLILPDGVIAGEKCNVLRKALTERHCIERVIELPRHIFRNTETKAYITVLSKNTPPRDRVSIQRLNPDGKLSPAIQIDSDLAGTRMDYTHFALESTKQRKKSRVIRDVVTFVKRGAFSSKQISRMRCPVVHTSTLNADTASVPGRFIVTRRTAARTAGVVAQKGDILVARVGRNLEQQVCIVDKGFAVVSDCIFVLRVKKQFRDRVFRYLRSAQGKNSLLGASHGVGAKFITTDALLNLSF